MPGNACAALGGNGMDLALKDLWEAVAGEVPGWGPGDEGSGIYKHWRENRQRLGSPVGAEHEGADGRPFQAFASGIIIRWDADGPHEV